MIFDKMSNVRSCGDCDNIQIIIFKMHQPRYKMMVLVVREIDGFQDEISLDIKK